MTNYEKYYQLKSEYDKIKKNLDALKEAIKDDLKKGDSLVIDDKIIFSDGIAKLTISENKTIKSAAAWELINAQPDADKYINYGTRENLTVKGA